MSSGSAQKTIIDHMLDNPLHFKRKKGAAHDVGVELDMVIPSQGEVRLLGNRHKQCTYYQIGKLNFSYHRLHWIIKNKCNSFYNDTHTFAIGVDVCHTQMLKDKADNFLACKEPLDGMWRCYTEGKYGQSIRDAPAFAKKYEIQSVRWMR